jgi:hypothetical protein
MSNLLFSTEIGTNVQRWATKVLNANTELASNIVEEVAVVLCSDTLEHLLEDGW